MFYRNFLDWNFRKKKNKFLQKFLGKFLLKKIKKKNLKLRVINYLLVNVFVKNLKF